MAQWRLNGFYDVSKTAGLFEAAQHRSSCRAFSAAPTTAQWNALTTASTQLALPGVRIALGLCDTKLFQPLGGILMKFENVQRFAAIIATDNDPCAVVNAGISGELFLLKAVESGLAGCWVTGTYKRGLVGIRVGDGEKLLGLIALGVPAKHPELPIQRKRKAITVICPEFEQLNSAFRELVQYVQIAPSAMNMQPWRIKMIGEKTMQISVGLPAQRIDLGIGFAHAVIALGSSHAHFELEADGLSATVELQ